MYLSIEKILLYFIIRTSCMAHQQNLLQFNAHGNTVRSLFDNDKYVAILVSVSQRKILGLERNECLDYIPG